MVELDGQPIKNSEQFRHLILAAPANVALRVKRAGEEESRELPLKLSGDPVRWGITWREDDAEPGMLYLLRVIDGSPGRNGRRESGDRIVSVNGQTFANQDEFQKLVAVDEIVLQLENEGKIRNATVRALNYPAKD